MLRLPTRSGAELLAWGRMLRRVRAEDQRKHTRRPVHIAAKMNVGRSLRDCAVLDISDNGARIAVERSQEVPDEITICMSPRGFPIRPCRVIWRSDTEIGVEFIAASAE
jgi:hypothetical protein